MNLVITLLNLEIRVPGVGSLMDLEIYSIDTPDLNLS